MELEYRQQLCKVCRDINFERYFQSRVANYVTKYKQIGADANALRLGYLEEIYNKSSLCPFCRLVLMAVCRNDTSWLFTPEQYISADGRRRSKTECWIYSYCFAIHEYPDPDSEKAYRIGIAARQSEDVLPNEADLIGSIQLLAEDAVQIKKSKLFHGRMFDSTKVDMRLASSWLRLCQTKHGDMCANLGPAFDCRNVRLYNLILINVEELCIIQTPNEPHDSWKFICLSYCWPAEKPFTLTWENRDEMLQRGSLKSRMQRLPYAIQDAIRCVRDLGEIFLWVDSLCIVQNDEEEKRHQIDQMDKIFSSALLTLVSASSERGYSEKGLPRYRNNTGIAQQHMEQVKNLRLTVPFDTLLKRLGSSRWMTRAWTYEERLLSKRLLYFTETQLYFQCSCSVFCEDTIGEGNPVSAYVHPASNLWNMGAPYASKIGNGNFGSHHLKRTSYLTPEDAIQDYQNYVMEYTNRNMSDESDVLRAFSGIEVVLKHSMSSEFYYGLPEFGLDSALLWTLAGAHKRRETRTKGSIEEYFPSWTWAGWDSPVEYGSYFFITGIRREIIWFLINQNDAVMNVNTEDTFEELKPTEGDNVRVGPVGQPPRGFSQEGRPISQVDTNKQDWRFPKYLACWTTTAVFHLTGEVEPLAHGFWKSGIHLRIFNDRKEWVGCIMMDQEWVTNHVHESRMFDFMLMSRSKAIAKEYLSPRKPKYFDEEIYADRPWCLLNVMLIERWGDIARRLGVGFIHENAWEQSSPVSILLKLE